MAVGTKGLEPKQLDLLDDAALVAELEKAKKNSLTFVSRLLQGNSKHMADSRPFAETSRAFTRFFVSVNSVSVLHQA